MTEEKKDEQKQEKNEEPKNLKEVETEKPVEKKEEPEKIEEKPTASIEEPKVEKPEEKPAPTGKFADLIKDIESLSVLELSELVKELENRFGVSAAVPIAAVGATSQAGAGDGEAGVSEEKSQFNIELMTSGDQKINVIKIVREITGVGLKDAKDLVDAAPKVIKENVEKAEAEDLKKKLEDAGATVELK